MEQNPYQPPASRVEDVGWAGGTPFYFAVSITKLVVLYLTTFGLYQVVWFYWHWRTIKERERADLRPVLRAVFAVFFCYSLFSRIRDTASRVSAASSFSAGACATTWILLTLTARLPSAYWLVTLASFLPLIPVQRAANQINQRLSPGHDPNGRFTGWNILVIVLGSIFFALVLVSLFVPDQQ